MKIALLTMTFNNNYGGLLQAYALMEYLKKLGHQPELLFVQLEDKSMKSFIKKYIMPFVSNKWLSIKEKNMVEKNMNYFIDTYINPKTAPIYTENDFKTIVSDKYDAYIIGSDQVWRPKMYRFINHAFFDFVKNDEAVKLSYAASFGVDEWEYTDSQTKLYKEQVKKFNAISVREDSGVKLCKSYFDVKAEHVLDPTLLLKVDDYRKIINKEKESSHDGKLLCYILDYSDEKKVIIDMISTKLNIKHFFVNDYKKINDKAYPSLTLWLKGFDNAEYVITDSFHGCLFSILFNKPFIVYGNKKRGMARFKSVLKMFDLEDRLVSSIEYFKVEMILKDIDWNKVNSKLNMYRSNSELFLRKNIS